MIMTKVEVHPRAKAWQFWALISALVFGVYAVTQVFDTPTPTRPPATVVTTVAPLQPTPMCQGPTDSQCWETAQDGPAGPGNPATWREVPRVSAVPSAPASPRTTGGPCRDLHDSLCREADGTWRQNPVTK